ncbi:MAG: hypothetical protein ACK4VI_01290 [Alphaproteobacteria bacterium]
MTELQTSLLREKFCIYDTDPDTYEIKSIIALSNRMVIELKGQRKGHAETFVVRAQNMHSCVRMAARIINTFKISGPIMSRPKAYDWEAAWDAVVNDYDYRFNPERWVAIYHMGQTVFQSGEHHPLLDVIEKCDARSKGAYDQAVLMAEDAFRQLGKNVKIEYDSNVALVVNLGQESGRFGVIMRGSTRTTTFNFSVQAKNNMSLNHPQCLAAAACFLEGVQLAFMVGMNNIKLYLGIIKRLTDDERKTKDAARRLTRLISEIANLERMYEVRYRPEKPDLLVLVAEAERHGQRVLRRPDDDDDDDSGAVVS